MPKPWRLLALFAWPWLSMSELRLFMLGRGEVDKETNREKEERINDC